MSGNVKAELGTEGGYPKGVSLGGPGGTRRWVREPEAAPSSGRGFLARLRLYLEGRRARVGGAWETAILSFGILLLKACGGDGDDPPPPVTPPPPPVTPPPPPEPPEPPEEDLDAGTGTPHSLTVGNSFVGLVEHSTDEDWVRIELERGDLMAATLQAEGPLGLDPVLVLRDAQGNLLIQSGELYSHPQHDALVTLTSGFSSRIFFSAETTGTYYLSVEGYELTAGDYRLTVEQVPDAEVGVGTGTTDSLAVGKSLTGSVEGSGDEDWVRIELEQGVLVAATLQTEGVANLDPVLVLRDAYGNVLFFNNNATSHPQDAALVTLTDPLSSRIFFSAETTGTYYLSVTGSGSTSAGDYQLTLEQVPAAEVGVGTGTTDSLALGDSFVGSVESGTAEDWVRIELDRGALVAATLQAEGASGLDPVLVLRDDHGNVLFINDDATSHPRDDALVTLTSDSSSRVFFRPQTTGTYYLSVEGYRLSTGDYRLTLEQVPAGPPSDERGDAAAHIGTAHSLAVGDSFTGLVASSGDEDWVRIELAQGDLVAATLQAAGSSGLDPMLVLRDAQGVRLTRNDDAVSHPQDDALATLTDPLSSRIFFSAETAGTYYLSVEGFGRTTGDYRLTLEQVPVDPSFHERGDAAAHIGTAHSLAIGESFVGSVENGGDEDWVRISLEEGDFVAVTLQAEGTPFLDPILILRDAQGNLLFVNNDADSHPQDTDLIPLTSAVSSRIFFSAETTGTYYLDVGGLGTAGGYQLTLERLSVDPYSIVPIDKDANTRTDHSLAVGDSFVGSVENGTDRDWVRISLEEGDFVAATLQAEGASDLDTVLVLYDAQGNPLFGNDDAKAQGLDLITLTDRTSSRIFFSPQTTGTYYLSAQGYQASTGDYRLTLEEVPPFSGTELSGRDYAGDNPWIEALLGAGNFWRSAEGASVEISYATQSGANTDLFDPSYVAPVWEAHELAALRLVMTAWASVTNISFVEAADAQEADIWYWLIDDEILGTGTLGLHQFPDPQFSATPLNGLFNQESASWNEAGLQAGGYAYLTLLHELGHGLGLAHPHDTVLFPGIQGGNDTTDYGTHDLNQGIYTVMTYNDGWPTQHHAYAEQYFDDFGYSRTPMALDIAAIQELYGANENYRTGDDVYSLPLSNGPGTWWECIWDAGGVDTISAEGGGDSCVIDLREAELTGPAAGGYASYASGVLGGFTIAKGAVIENALGGSGDDALVSNSADNRLSGGEGADRFVFSDAFGNDLITDFESDEDFLVFQDFTEVGSFAEFLAASKQDGSDVVYDFADDGENVLKLADVQLEDLTEANLIFEMFDALA